MAEKEKYITGTVIYGYMGKMEKWDIIIES